MVESRAALRAIHLNPDKGDKGKERKKDAGDFKNYRAHNRPQHINASCG